MNRTLVIVLAVVLEACSSGSVRKDLQENPALSCVSGDLANFFAFASGSGAHAAVRAMDGKKVGTRNSICVDPGEHYVTTGAANSRLTGQGYMKISMEAGKTYKLRAEFEETTFLIKLMETSAEGEEREIQQQRVTASNGGGRW